MTSAPIDWHGTTAAAVLVVVGILAIIVAWKLSKFLLKLGVLLVLLAIAAGCVLWWSGRHF